jgi:hypothetical protein
MFMPYTTNDNNFNAMSNLDKSLLFANASIVSSNMLIKVKISYNYHLYSIFEIGNLSWVLKLFNLHMYQHS